MNDDEQTHKSLSPPGAYILGEESTEYKKQVHLITSGSDVCSGEIHAGSQNRETGMEVGSAKRSGSCLSKDLAFALRTNW